MGARGRRRGGRADRTDAAIQGVPHAGDGYRTSPRTAGGRCGAAGMDVGPDPVGDQQRARCRRPPAPRGGLAALDAVVETFRKGVAPGRCWIRVERDRRDHILDDAEQCLIRFRYLRQFRNVSRAISLSQSGAPAPSRTDRQQPSAESNERRRRNAIELHVATTGSDHADGSETTPFRTINRAAALAQPGDTVIVHGGEYREWVQPRRGGLSDQRRITYTAAAGEHVVIKGSEPVTGWERVSDRSGRSQCRTHCSAPSTRSPRRSTATGSSTPPTPRRRSTWVTSTSTGPACTRSQASTR